MIRFNLRPSGLVIPIGLSILLSLTGCARSPADQDTATQGSTPRQVSSPTSTTASASLPVVATTTYPVDFLVGYLAGDSVQRRLTLPEGGDPAHGSPAVENILELQKTDLIVAHGAGYETWMATASLPSKVVATADGLDLLKTTGRTHSHGKEGEHSHGVVDPRSWMDPMLFREQARVVHGILVERWPRLSEIVDARLAELEDELRAIDDELTDLLSADERPAIAAWTLEPGRYAYWARRYQLDIQRFDPESFDRRAFEVEVSDLEVIEDQLSRGGLLLVTQPLTESNDDGLAKPLVVELDGLDHPDSATGQYDYLAQAQNNINRLRQTQQDSSTEGSR